MSQLVRLEGKHTAQSAHCALERYPSEMYPWVRLSRAGLVSPLIVITRVVVNSHFPLY